MGFRMDQHYGLSKGGTEYLKEHGKVLGHRVVQEEYVDGEVKVLSKSPLYDCEVYDEWPGSFDPTPLRKYVAEDGTIFQEAIQLSSWDSGPMIFMAFKDASGEWIEETLWTPEELQEATGQDFSTCDLVG